ncbi:hypothetical protein MIMGU_mgv1a017244mg [Erythranthe guttata]|uniref:Uncharacterized protein n=1 Tax=Erythranthe guttata TaxID=4155 RepID=A0A022PUK8_ERYGU|nr:hypothetical protein MIMGU_mgv1a017244mg [Erythranthe guttata]
MIITQIDNTKNYHYRCNRQTQHAFQNYMYSNTSREKKKNYAKKNIQLIVSTNKNPKKKRLKNKKTIISDNLTCMPVAISIQMSTQHF